MWLLGCALDVAPFGGYGGAGPELRFSEIFGLPLGNVLGVRQLCCGGRFIGAA